MASAPITGRPRLLQSAEGLSRGAYGPVEWTLLVGIAAIWGSSFLLMEVGLQSLRPGVITFLRLLLGAAALGLIPRARRRVDGADLPRVALLGIVYLAAPLSLFPLAQQHVDSSLAGMVNGTVPVMTALWSLPLLRRVPGRRQLAGLAMGFAGLVAITGPTLGASPSAAFGTGLLLLAVVLYGLAVNLAVPLQQRYGALPVLFHAQLIALVATAPVALLHLPGSSFAPGPVLAMVPLGALGTGLAFVAMTTLVGRVGSVRGSVAVYFTPVVAVVLGVTLLGEAVEPVAVLGVALVLAGAWLTSRADAGAQPVPAVASAGAPLRG